MISVIHKVSIIIPSAHPESRNDNQSITRSSQKLSFSAVRQI